MDKALEMISLLLPDLLARLKCALILVSGPIVGPASGKEKS